MPTSKPALYHYAAHDHSLRQIRRGDFRRTLVEASGEEPSVAAAPAILVCTSTFWRNAWKYRARAYRHCYWDCGTMLANLFGVAAANSIPARLVLGFADTARQCFARRRPHAGGVAVPDRAGRFVRARTARHRQSSP